MTPSELGYLSSLAYLDLSYNSLSVVVPSTFANLLSLQTLYNHNNNITGKVAEDFCTFLGNTTIEYTFKADCTGEQMEPTIDCPCCTECYSHFSFFEHYGVCNGVEIKIQIYNEKSETIEQYWSLKDNSMGNVILKDRPYTTDS